MCRSQMLSSCKVPEIGKAHQVVMFDLEHYMHSQGGHFLDITHKYNGLYSRKRTNFSPGLNLD